MHVTQDITTKTTLHKANEHAKTSVSTPGLCKSHTKNQFNRAMTNKTNWLEAMREDKNMSAKIKSNK